MIPWGQKRVAMMHRMDISAALQGCITKESGDLVCDSVKKYRKEYSKKLAKPRLISALLSIFANLSYSVESQSKSFD